MENKNLVSIVIPVYNVELYLRACLDSVINQTYSNLEIICINDGSTDSSLSILMEYQKKDSRLKIISRENRGLLASRIEGFKNSTGEFILNLDSDDYLEINAVECLIRKQKKYNCDVIRFEHFINDKKNIEKTNDKLLSKDDFELNFYSDFFTKFEFNSACFNFFKKNIYNIDKNIDYSISMGEDLTYNIGLYTNMNSILIIPDALYHYRVNNASITRKLTYQSIKKNILSSYKAYTYLFNSLEKFNLSDIEKYKPIVAARLIIENYYLMLKSFSVDNECYNKLKLDSLNEIDLTPYLKFISIADLKKVSRGHNLFIKAMYKNNEFMIKMYAKLIYLNGLKIRRMLDE